MHIIFLFLYWNMRSILTIYIINSQLCIQIGYTRCLQLINKGLVRICDQIQHIFILLAGLPHLSWKERHYSSLRLRRPCNNTPVLLVHVAHCWKPVVRSKCCYSWKLQITDRIGDY